MAAPLDQDDGVMDRLLQEAQREFPHWRFTRTADGWTATRGDTSLSAASLAELRARLRPETPGWRVWQSDKGHWWATRKRPLSAAEDAANVWRTVEADTEDALRDAIAEQESRAALAAAS